MDTFLLVYQLDKGVEDEKDKKFKRSIVYYKPAY